MTISTAHSMPRWKNTRRSNHARDWRNESSPIFGLSNPSGATHGWWRWTLAALAVAVVVAIALGWRSGRPTQPEIANHPQTTNEAPREPERQAVNHGENTVRAPRRGTIRRTATHRSNALAAANPKLDQFPSPQPLSEQERVLAQYVRDYPQEAGLIARMQEESEKEIQQRMTEANSESSSHGSDREER
jgi:hypothetical protein